LQKNTIMDDPSSRSRRMHHPKHSAGYSYLLLFLVCSLSVAAVIWLLPPLMFVFGVGWVAPLFTVLIVFSIFLLFRRLIFKHLYGKMPNESEMVLMEYFAQHSDDEDEDVSTELIENALHLREVTAGECMAKREDVVSIAANASIPTLKTLFVESHLSRIIVTENGSLDQVLGYVHVQQMFGSPSSIRRMLLPIRFVSASMPGNELINLFVPTRTNIACVQDESGQLAGIVTLEDVLEQLFGAIEDEHD
jgi:putative hemolysin